MKGAGRGKREPGSGKREPGSGKRAPGSGKRAPGSGEQIAAPPATFAAVMREWQMTAPEALARSINHALGVDCLQGAASAGSERDQPANPREAIRASEDLLDRVLAGACESRDSALDLLTVDALVTRALEIAARDPKLLAEFPELAMKRLSAR